MRHPLQRRKLAFTLTEILLVGGILAVLAVLAFPALSSAKASADKTRCAHNIRAVGSGILLWAGENNGRLPAYGNIANNTQQKPTWGEKAAKAMGINIAAKGQKTVFMCPLDQTYKTKQGAFMHTSYIGHNSYTINVEIMDWETGVSALGGAAKGGSFLSAISHPSQTILVGEHHTENNVIDWGAGNGRTWRPGYTNEYSMTNKDEKEDAAKRGYHRGVNNWCFSDGHVEVLNFKNTLSPRNLWKPIKTE